MLRSVEDSSRDSLEREEGWDRKRERVRETCGDAHTSARSSGESLKESSRESLFPIERKEKVEGRRREGRVGGG